MSPIVVTKSHQSLGAPPLGNVTTLRVFLFVCPVLCSEYRMAGPDIDSGGCDQALCRVSGDRSSQPTETPDPIPGYLPALSLKVIRTLMFCSRFYPGRDPCNLSHMISSHIILGSTCDEAQYALIERDPANRHQGGHCQDKRRHFVIKSNCSK